MNKKIEMSTTELKTRCPAKVNLTFEILGTLSDGYHEVCTLLQAVSLEDELTFRFSFDSETSVDSNYTDFKSIDSKSNDSSSINSNSSDSKNRRDDAWRRPASDEQYTKSSLSRISYDSYQSEFSAEFPMDETNLISKAIRAYQNVVPESKYLNVGIDIKKRIPLGAGLAGGSANAAAALVAINSFFAEKLSHDELLKIGASLGADVPFSLQGGTCIGTHKGDVLQKLDNAQKLVLLLVKPSLLSVSTPWAFKEFDLIAGKNGLGQSTVSNTTNYTDTSSNSATKICADTLVRSEVPPRSVQSAPFDSEPSSVSAVQSTARAMAKTLKNDLEQVVFAEHKDLESVRQAMESHGAIAARLTGSGPTLYALIESTEHAELLKNKLLTFQSEYNNSKIFPLDFWIAESFSRGARVIEE